jgi:hypothetical protein
MEMSVASVHFASAIHEPTKEKRVAGNVDYEQMAKELLERTMGHPDQHLRDAVSAQAASLAAEDVSLRSGASHRQGARQKLHEDALWAAIGSVERKRMMVDEALWLDPD